MADPVIRRIRALLGQGLGGLVPVAPASPAGKFLNAAGDWATPAGGGGASTHSSLAGLSWAASGHVDTARSIPWFAGAGAASTFGIGSVGQFLGSAGLTPSWSTPSHAALVALDWTASGHTSQAYVLPWFAAAGAASTFASGGAGTFLGMAGLTPAWSIPAGSPSGADVAVADGGTGASDASTARTNLGLGAAAVANIGADLEETAGEVCASDDHRLWGPNFGNYRNAAVHANVGTPAPVAYGTTITTRGGGAAADATDATGAMESRTTSASANNSAGWWVGGTPILTARQLAPEFVAVIVTPADITLYRICVGLMSTESAADNPANHHAVLAYSTVRGDGGWVILTKDGATQTVSGTVLAIAASTRYVIRGVLSAAGVFSGTINGTAFSASATPPGSTNALGIIAQCQCTTAAARSITLGRVAFRSL